MMKGNLKTQIKKTIIYRKTDIFIYYISHQKVCNPDKDGIILSNTEVK